MVLPIVIEVKNGPGNSNKYLLIVDVGTSSTIKSATLALMDGSGLTWRISTECDEEELNLHEPPAMRRCHHSDKTRLMKKVSVRHCWAALCCGCYYPPQCGRSCGCTDFVLLLFGNFDI